MGVPNIQQQLYLKTALNESKDGMFDHPADLDEGSHMKSIRFAQAGRFDDSTLASDKAQASEMRRGGASKRSMKAHFNKGNYAAGTRAQKRFDKAAREKRRAALKAKGIAEALEEKLELNEGGYQAKRMRVFRTRKPFSPEVADFMGRSFNKKRARDERISASAGGVGADTVRRQRRDAAMNAKGIKERYPMLKITEGSLGSAKLHKGGEFDTRKYRKLQIKNAVRNLRSHGLDPNLVKLPLSVGIENYGFHTSAAEKKNKALKAKGLLPAPKPLSPEVAASAGRIGRLARQRRGMDY